MGRGYVPGCVSHAGAGRCRHPGGSLSFEALQPFLTAAAIGLLLGLEREWSHRAGARQAAGSRTFALLALAGAVAASFGPGVVAAGLAGVGALLAIGYARTSAADPGLTTEVAAGAAYLLGALAWREGALAVGLAVLIGALLVSKPRLHHLAREIVTDVEVEDAVKLLVVAFVVLPLLPSQDLGPFGVLNPRRIWKLVLALTGIGWLGYLGTRILGTRRGLLFAGLAGGFVSASATTATMARLARDAISRAGSAHEATRAALHGPLSAAIAASVATVMQLAAVLVFVNRPLLERLVPALALSGVALLVVAAMLARRAEGAASQAPPSGRPFALRPALVLAGLLTLALLISRAGTAWLGAGGAIAAAGLAGLVDAHAGALAAATLGARGELTLAEATWAVAASLGTNTGMKVVLAFAGGGARFGWPFAAAIAAAVAGFGVGVVLGR
jgi:uncharacterized membrane protein (DUF4010 family)